MGCQNDFPLLYQQLVESIPVGICVFQLEKFDDDSSLRLIFANKIAEQIIGVGAGDILGKTLDENFPELRKEGIPQIYAEVVRSKKPVILDDVFYGDEWVDPAWFSVKAFPVGEDMVGASFENITERKDADRALAEKEEHFRTIFHQSPLSLQVMSVAGWMLEVNRSWEELWQAKGEDVIGKFNVLDDAQAISIGLTDKFKLATLGEAVDLSEIYYDPQLSGFPGRGRWLSSRIYPIKDVHDKVKYIIIAHLDITELKKSELELLAHQEELEEKVRTRTSKLLETNDQLQQALSEVRQLSGFLPICASCKKIRDDKGYWNQIESYIRDHSEAEFSHSICPGCTKKLYPDFCKKKEG
ncbi:MAG: PAS domain-containing protein [Thermodesulfobacteriota bacterium]